MRRKALLLLCVGTWAHIQYLDLEELEVNVPQESKFPKYEAAVTRLKSRFLKKHGVAVARDDFHNRAQRPGESVAEFLASLRAMARDCEFENYSPEAAILTQLISKTSNAKVRDRLLMEEEKTLTLEKAVNMAARIEQKGAESARLAQSGGRARVGAMVDSDVEEDEIYAITTKGRTQARRQGPKTGDRRYGRCGARTHDSEFSACPAKNAKGMKCLKLGHYGDGQGRIQEMVGVYNATPHGTTGTSPSELLHGQRMRTRLEVSSLRREEEGVC